MVGVRLQEVGWSEEGSRVARGKALEAARGRQLARATPSRLAGSPRSGEMILSAARDWDFRGRYEPIPHVSSHGALHREHMLVPLIVNRPVARAPRRTVDVMASALDLLGLATPSNLDGTSYVTEGGGLLSPDEKPGLAQGRTDDDRDAESAVA